MCERRDHGLIRIPRGMTKTEVRKLLGNPQNTDKDSEVWMWVFDWTDYVAGGFPRDWRTMSENSSGDGLWIGFDENDKVRTPLWSLSAATPPARDYDR